MKVAMKSDDAFATRCTSCKSHRSTCGFGTAIHKANSFTRRNTLSNRFSQFHFSRSGCAIRRAVTCSRSDCLCNFWMRMAKDDGSVTLHKVDELVAFNVVDIRTVSARHNVWRSAHCFECTNRRVDTARDCTSRTFKN